MIILHFQIFVLITNRPFPPSSKQWRRVEAIFSGGQKYNKSMKMSTPTSLWCYCSNALKRNAGKVYISNYRSLDTHSLISEQI